MNRTASSTLIAALALLVLLGVALAAGCTSTPSTTTPTTSPTAVGTTAAAGTVTTAGTSGSSSGSVAVAAVGADRLVPFIPKAVGAWKLDGDAQTVTMKDAEGRDFTMVNGDYVKDGNTDTKGTIIIMDSAVAKTPYKEQWSSFRSIETNDGWWKSVTVKGQPSWKSFTKSSNDYGQWVLAGDRYIVIATVDSGTEADLDALVNAIDISGLAALK